MATDSDDQNKEGKSGQRGGFIFNAPVNAETANFINGNVENLTVNNLGLSADELIKLDGLLRPLEDQVRAIPQSDQNQAEKQVQELHSELAKGKNANSDRLNQIIDGLLKMVPGALGAMVSMFANPILGGLVGPVAEQVLGHLKGSGT